MYGILDLMASLQTLDYSLKAFFQNFVANTVFRYPNEFQWLLFLMACRLQSIKTTFHKYFKAL